MGSDRREFLGSVLAAGLVAGTVPPLESDAPDWLRRIRGRHRAVFDSPRDDGAGVIRAWIWLKQCEQVLGARPSDCSAVVVLRHGGLSGAMDDAFWEQYELSVGNSTAEKPNIPGKNPQMAAVMKSTMGSYPPPARPWADGVGLDSLMARGGIVVGCEFAFWGIVSRVMNHDKVEEAVARKRATAHLVPGVTLVPSGFFALAAAQNQGCGFVTNL